MVKFYKIISVILHPIVIPTMGLMLYFLLIPTAFNNKERLTLLSLVFVTTYLIPLCILILFKKLNIIKNFNSRSIKERKIPIKIMIVLYYLLGNTFNTIAPIKDIGLLFYATSAALALIYILFLFQLKTSIHLLSFGIFSGFFLLLGFLYTNHFPLVLIITILLAGVVANARLHLKAHTPVEVYLGYFLGFISPFGIYFLL